MFDLKLEHLLLFVIAIFLLYHLLGGCYNRVVDGLTVLPEACGQKTSLLLKTICGHQGTITENQKDINTKLDEIKDINTKLDEIKDILAYK
jgi:hypothetical protein